MNVNYLILSNYRLTQNSACALKSITTASHVHLSGWKFATEVLFRQRYWRNSLAGRNDAVLPLLRRLCNPPDRIFSWSSSPMNLWLGEKCAAEGSWPMLNKFVSYLSIYLSINNQVTSINLQHNSMLWLIL